MRPASHMPLAAMTIWKPDSLSMALLSSTLSVQRKCGDASSLTATGSRLGVVALEHLGGADGQRQVEKNGRRWNVAAVHQVDEIGDQFLRALDREGGDEQRARRRACAACTSSASRLRRLSAVTGGRSVPP